MKKNPICIEPNENISNAIKLMKLKKSEMIPVHEKKLFIGMLQKKYLLKYEFESPKLLKNQEILAFEDRILGNYHSGEKGKTIVFMCGIHGNELSGKKALKKIFSYLENNKIDIRGNIIGVQGNLKAIEKKERYIDIDLNRIWTKKIIDKVKKGKIKDVYEYKELIKIHDIMDVILKKKKKKDVIIIDLHNTSSASGLFTVINNTKDFKLASAIQIPVITKLFNKVKGSFSQYYNSKNISTIVFEGGAIGDPASTNNHEIGIFKILESCGAIKKEDTPNFITNQSNSKNKKNLYKVKYIHLISESDNFLMKPNVINFQNVKKGEVLGSDKNGDVISPFDGKILMPLYQEQGREGFYIIQNENLS